MSARSEIREKLEDIMRRSDALACEIWSGRGYDGVVEMNGWFYRPFGRQNAIYLGRNKAEALETIAEIRREREEARGY